MRNKYIFHEVFHQSYLKLGANRSTELFSMPHRWNPMWKCTGNLRAKMTKLSINSKQRFIMGCYYNYASCSLLLSGSKSFTIQKAGPTEWVLHVQWTNTYTVSDINKTLVLKWIQCFNAAWQSRLRLRYCVKPKSIIQMQLLFSHRSEHWTTAHSHSHTYTQSGQYGQQMLNTPTRIHPNSADNNGYCGGKNEREPDRVQMEREKEKRNFSFCHRFWKAQCMPSSAVREACCGQICSWTFAQSSTSYANGTHKHWHCLDRVFKTATLDTWQMCLLTWRRWRTARETDGKAPSCTRTHSALTNCPELKPLATWNKYEPAQPIPTHPKIVHR